MDFLANNEIPVIVNTINTIKSKQFTLFRAGE